VNLTEAQFLVRRFSETDVPAVRLVVTDDHPVVRFGVRNMLMSEPGFEVVAEAEDGEGAITQTLEHQPDVLLLDLQMPRLLGLDATRAIMSQSPRVKIVLLTSTISTHQIIEALKLGIRGIVLKDSVGGELTESIRAVTSGDYWIGGERVVNLVQALQRLTRKAAEILERKTFGLSLRELDVVQCILEGCSNKDIAKQLNMSEETVKRHLRKIFDNTGVSTRLELALFALSHKLVAPH
jgi:DNA-binding NarL/FixJ family response regulator